MKRAGGPGLKIDVLVESDHWQNAGAAKIIIRRALKRAAATLSTKTAELAIVLTDDAAIRNLNRNWRGVDAATNVLAFPVRSAAPHSGTGRRPVGTVNNQLDPGSHLSNNFRTQWRNQLANHLGDVVLAYETVKREARRDGKSFDHHLAHLVVHGFLHLLGYGHLNDAQARRMETTEQTILRHLAMPDPYGTTRPRLRRAGRRGSNPPRRSRARRTENA